MSNREPTTDGGTDDSSNQSAQDSKRVQRGADFHEATGGFDEVFKALFILFLIGLALYVYFLVL